MEYQVPILTRLLGHPRTKKRKRAYGGSERFKVALNMWQFMVEDSTIEITDTQIHYTMEVAFVAKQQGQVCILTEYIGEDEPCDKMMDEPLANLPDTIVHRQLFQLLVACLILKKQYDCDLFSRAFLIQVHRDGVTKHALPTEMIQHAEAIYAKEQEKYSLQPSSSP